MQAIQTKVIPPTNFKPLRIKAWCARGSLTTSSWPDSLAVSDSRTHAHVARLLCDKFCTEHANTPKEHNTWNAQFITGCLPNGDYCHTFREPSFTVYRCRFQGREVGAIGRMNRHSVALEARSPEHARRELYKTHDSIVDLSFELPESHFTKDA